MRINTNTNSMLALRNFQNVSTNQKNAQSKMASGDRIQSAAFDPSGLAISETMNATIRSQSQVKRNINDGVSLLQVAEGSLSELSNLGIRLRELAIQASSDTVNDEARVMADYEFRSLKEEIKRLTSSSKFNGNHILDGNSNYELQIGTNNDPFQDRIEYNLSKILDAKSNFGLDTIDLRTKTSAQNSISKVDKMMQQVGESRAKIGASQNRLESMFANLQVGQENLISAKSLIRDADMAKESAENVKGSIQKNATVMMMQTVNSNPSKVLKLLE
ncbi:flagellin [Halobacteriovorax sp. HLS]|uniref:flagellin n=1 Tax=Halobacteriovorax sp. HLS TaxID=2234000 RepID=UPI000FD92C86|nr:flagellin [Halobacteriovorax sp. HLS]